jgi:hypothetical protein
MAYESPPLISRESPRNRRRRRHAQQQSSCCCCLLVAVSLLIVVIAWRGPIFSIFGRHHRDTQRAGSAAFPLELTSDATSYLRFNLVRLSVTLVDARGNAVTDAATPPQITVTRDGQTVSTIGDFRSVATRYDRNLQAYVASWPVPWNCPAGEYVAEARMKLADPEAWTWQTEEMKRQRRRERRRAAEESPPAGETWCIARTRFVITGLAPRTDVPKGTCVATWEPDFRATGIRKPDGTMGDWRAMFDWCDFMGADTFWFRGAVTEVYEGDLSLEQPFNQANIAAIPQMAAEAHHRGLRFGTWASAYSTYPARSNRGKPKYDYAQDISRGTGAVRSLDFISLFDRRRVDHIASFFGQAQADPNVDYLGLDYMRSDRGGYEMVDRFVQEMPLRLPNGFAQWSQAKRWGYVAQKVEREWQKDPRFYDAWNWFRAHTGAENVRDMIAASQLRKPLWIFVLSWWHGKQHGQDPLMFTDAGVGLLAPMLYQVPNRLHFDTMVRDWNAYLAAGQANVCPGDQVDFQWHQYTLRPAAPEEFYDRIVTAHGAKGKGYLQGGLTIGGFVHDINRLQTPHSGGRHPWPHPGTEWALAGGAAFSTIRMNWRVLPLVAKLEMPSSAPLNTTVEGQLTIENVTKKPVSRVTVALEKTEGVELAGPLETVSLRGRDTVIKRVAVRIKGGHGDRANRLMVCVRLRWPDDDYGPNVRRDLPPMILAMDYVQGK